MPELLGQIPGTVKARTVLSDCPSMGCTGEQHQSSAHRAASLPKEPCITTAGTVGAFALHTCECQHEELRMAHSTGDCTHTQTQTHTPVRWIIQSGIAPDFYQHNFRMFYHYSQEVNPWTVMQTIPSECQQDFQTPSHCHATVLVTYFIRTDVFQLLENFWDIHFWTVFFRKSLFMHLGATNTGETVCKEEKVWDIQKAGL